MKIASTLILILFFVRICKTQSTENNTVGLLLNSQMSNTGYNLFSPMGSTSTYLIDNEGRLINDWSSTYLPGLSAYLDEEGNLYRAGQIEDIATFNIGGAGGLVEKFDWNNNLMWQFEYSDELKRQHHDFEVLPNGNVLILAWELKTREEAIEAGRDPNSLNIGELWPDHLVEIRPNGASGGEIIWEWHVWDHLIQDFDPTKENFGVVKDHPELVDVNYSPTGNADWNHTNNVDYNENLDQIVLCVRSFSEFWVIDHSTTVEESASHEGGNMGRGGDLLYRWGNPATYKRGEETDQKLFKQHNVHWIPADKPDAGKILIFNNGTGRPELQYSSIEIVSPPMDTDGSYVLREDMTFGPEEPEFVYTDEVVDNFYADRLSSAQQLKNGNILICNGPSGTFFEITPDREISWKYLNPVTTNGVIKQGELPGSSNSVFNLIRYALDYPAFSNKNIIPGKPIEGEKEQVVLGIDSNPKGLTIYPNPSGNEVSINLDTTDRIALRIFSFDGRLIRDLITYNGEAVNLNDLTNGVYFFQINRLKAIKVVVQK